MSWLMFGYRGGGRASWRTITINAFDTPNLDGLPLEALRLLPKGCPRMTDLSASAAALSG